MTEIDKEIEDIIKNERIYSVYQPIVSLRDCEVIGFEALSRIKGESIVRNSEELFYYASQNGMIWLLEQVCRKESFKSLKNQYKEKYNKLLFLNVSPGVINDNTFREGFTLEYANENCISPSQIVFEITEHEAINDLNSFLAALKHYQKQMYGIAIDDVGTGYSSLGLICDVRPQYVKIDIRIIKDINKNRLHYATVKSLANLAEAANIELIAEGVETKEEMEALIKLNVHYAQGYYFSRPYQSFCEGIEHVKQVQDSVKKANRIQNHFYSSPINSFCIDNIVVEGITIPATMRVHELFELFQNDSELIGVTVISNSQTIGIITREQFDHKLSGRYGFSLFQNKEVVTIMDSDFLEVDYSASIKEVSDMAMSRRREAIYDFIVVTKNNEYYGIVTIKELLLNSMEINVYVARDTNPLTGLPGNNLVQQQINAHITQNINYSIIYIDIDNFKAFNDVYGFAKGDKIIKILANALEDVSNDNDFIGHIGGDDFLVILDGYRYSEFFKNLSNIFTSKTKKMYTKADQENGFITALNRNGTVEDFPLVSLTASVVTNQDKNLLSSNEVMALLAKRKKQGKLILGNSLISD